MASNSAGVYGTNGSITSGTVGADGNNFNNITNYALFAGGLDMTNAAARIYDPFVTGFDRLFMIRGPQFLTTRYQQEYKTFKHILEYGNTGVSGIGDITLEVDPMQGGYTGKNVDIGTMSKDDTNEFTVKVYEFSGSPVRNFLHLWVTGIADPMSGLATYHGALEDSGDNNTPSLTVNQANHTGEFIYVITDRSGTKLEYSCMLANCMPKKVPISTITDVNAGDHNLATFDVSFTCVKYESIAINFYAQKLLNKYKLLSNHLNFNPGIQDLQYSGVTAVESNLAPNKDLATSGPKNNVNYQGDQVYNLGT